MADMIPQGLPSPEADHTHELSDVSARGIVGAAGCLAGICAAVLLVLWGLLTLFASRPAPPPASLSPLARLPQTPPGPQLQAFPPDDLAAFRAREDAELNGYGWVDRPAGRVRVPIERAKDLFLQEYAATAASHSSALRQPIGGARHE